MGKASYMIHPGRSLGPFYLGASLQETLIHLKKTQAGEGSVDVTFSDSDPVTTPVLVTVKADGVRLRFDGAEQRLRLIEILDFRSSVFTYQGLEIHISNDSDSGLSGASGPSYRTISKLFGPTFAPELIPSDQGDDRCILSYPGLAFSFLVSISRHRNQAVDASSILANSPNTLATSFAVFLGRSWSDARTDLGLSNRAPPSNKSISAPYAIGQADIHHATMHGEGRLVLYFANGTSFPITLSTTTPQDLLSALGPPTRIYHKRDRRLSIHQSASSTSSSSGAANIHANSPNAADTPFDHFYNYPHHGLDILISTPTPPSAPSPTVPECLTTAEPADALPAADTPVATKVLLHGNVPGSHSFNKYRRLRWTIEHCPSPQDPSPLGGEMKWHTIARRLGEVWGSDGTNGAGAARAQEAMRGMRLERGGGGDVELEAGLGGGFEEVEAGSSTAGEWDMGMNAGGGGGGLDGPRSGDSGRRRNKQESQTTMLYGFPGMVFEVGGNGCVEGLLVY